MSWSAYEVATVVSGGILVLWSLFDGDDEDQYLTAGLRLGGAAVGVAFVVYAFYVAAQTSGTWTFPVGIFVLPVVACWRLLRRFAPTGADGTAATSPPQQRDVPDDPHRAAASRPDAPTPSVVATGGDADVATAGAPTTHAGEPRDPAEETLVDPELFEQLRHDVAEAPTAGWYEDPGGSGAMRWWDGGSWTTHTRSDPTGS